MKAAANAEKGLRQQDLAKHFKRKRIIATTEYLEGTHLFERTFSDKGVGEMREMKGVDAKELNDHLFKAFIVACDANIEGRSLERWKVKERHIQ